MAKPGVTVIKEAFIRSIPVMAGYIVLGVGFGILLRDAGYGVAWAFAMSLLIYAGSMQFVGVSLLAGGASLLTAAPHGLPELIAALSVVVLQVWKRNSLISILSGTVIYMLLVQLVF